MSTASNSLTQDDKLLEQNYLSKASELFKSGDFEASVAAYDKALEVNPKNATTYKEKGLALSRQGKYEAAVASYKKAIQIDPENKDVHMKIGWNLSELDQYEDAIAAYKKVIEIDPENDDAYMKIGWNLYKLNQNEAAIVSYKKAIEIFPENGYAYFQIGSNLNLLGQMEASIAACKKALEINPYDCESANLIGECYTVLGNFKEAVEAYDQAIRINPKDPWAYDNKGFALYHLGKIEEAVQWYDKQLEVRPDAWVSYLKKGKALQDLSKVTEALEYIQKGMDIVNQGKLEGNCLTHPNGKNEILNDLEVQMIAGIKELIAIPTLNVTSDEPEEVKVHIQNLNKRKDALKLKFVDVVLSVKKETSKQQEMNQLKKELEEVKNMYKQIVIEVAEVKADIQDSGMKELAEVKRGFKALEDQDPELLAYCKTFYWTSINLFGAYRAMSTGLIQANFETEATQKEDLLVNGAKKAMSLLADVASGVPIVGGVMSLLDTVIDGIYGAVKENRFNNKVAAINKVIQAKLGTEDDISLNVSKAALAITLAKKRAILYPELPNPTSAPTSEKIKAGLKWLAEKVDEIKEKVLPSVELHDKASTGATMGLQDVTLFMAYICKNHESIIKRREGLDKQIVSIVEYNGLDQMLEDRIDDMQEMKTKEMSERSRCCTMF